MQAAVWFYILCALVAAAMIGLLIMATRLCYRIEARSGRPMGGKSGLPGYANVIPAAFNLGVARDEETQALRWKMNSLLLAILAGFVVLYALKAVFTATA